MSQSTTHQAAEFLETILPSSGVYAAIRFVPKSDGKVLRVHEWVSSAAEAAARVLYWSAQGFDTYHACASFKEAGSDFKGRTQANVSEVAAFWLDIDCGPDKDYPDPATALQALGAFCRASCLPKPTLVGSGGGIHAYWPLEEPLAPAIWRPHARALGALAAVHGLKIDPARTADHASILRTPGTHNHKNGGRRPVTLLWLSDIFTNETILPKLAAAAAPVMPSGMEVDVGKTYAGDGVPTYGELVAHACPQMAAMRDSRGNIPEPDWYGCMTILARCADGDELAHAWSNGHPDYDFDDTVEKLAHAKAAPGPTTCTRFAELNPDLCAACPNQGKIKSPITLGVSAKLPEMPPDIKVEVPSTAPEGYFFSQSGAVCYMEHDKNTDTNIPRVLYPHTFYVDKIRWGETTMNSHMLIRHYIPGEGYQTFPVPMKDANGLGLWGHLGANNVGILPGERKRMEDYILRSFRLCNDQMRREMGYEQFGWKDDGSFIYGSRRYRPDGKVEDITIGVGNSHRDETLRQRAKGLAPIGTLEAWRGVAQELTSDGLEPQLFALLCGFAAPLMALLGPSDGGAILSLLGKKGQGKSYAAAAATSVWGAAKECLWLITKDNYVTVYTSLAMLRNFPMVMDDAQKFTKDEARGFACDFTDGREKLRGTVDGGIKSPSTGWKTIMILTTNESIVDKIGTAQDASRIFEVWCERPEKYADQFKRNGDRMAATLQANRGVAGDFFMRRLVLPEYRAQVEGWLQAMHEKVAEKASGPEDRFWVRLITCVLTAAYMVNRMGLLNCSVQRIWDWAAARMAEQQAGVTFRGEEPANALARFLNEHVAQTLTVIGEAGHNRKVAVHQEPRGSFFIRKELSQSGDPVRCYIEQKELRRWATENGLNLQDITQGLIKEGVARRGEAFLFSLGKGTHLASGQVKVWEIDLTMPQMAAAPKAVEMVA